MTQKGQGRHPWLQVETFVSKLAQWGIDPSTQVIAYDDGDGAFAARLWFLLRSLGHEKVAVLDGGWSHWVSLGLPTTSMQRAPMTVRPYPAVFDTTYLLDTDAVQAHLDDGGMLLDARAAVRFRGEGKNPLIELPGMCRARSIGRMRKIWGQMADSNHRCNWLPNLVNY